ncbi:MAG: heme A synthase [Chromatiales bacterium 21-64-14]|nr:MAG: heme A synthase [Chromatiales bacterium 21-64-14]
MADTASRSAATTDARRPIALWLLICCAMIYGMVILGGLTRLTGSGLSMVRWNPIFGIVPPLSQSAWQKAFTQYQKSPEYREVNFQMDLAGFKRIYYVEYAHRVLGRTIGLVFLVPFLYFWVRRKIPRGLSPRLVTMFILGGLQGLLGWYMVKSGLVNVPHVSQYRLTAHLGLALIIYVFILWTALDLLLTSSQAMPARGLRGLRRFATAVACLVFVTMLAGGFVAGLKAGFAYNTFPLMDGRWVPLNMFLLQPFWRNFFENIATVQFDHRVLAILTFLSVCSLWLVARRYTLARRARIGLNLWVAMVFVQVGLGISTLLLYVPTPLASAHQAGAVALLTLAVFTVHELRSGGAAGGAV